MNKFENLEDFENLHLANSYPLSELFTMIPPSH